MKTTLISMTFV